jgi:NADH:ubiquinone oxidoreductase subunit 6 (subunit J)
MNLTLLLLGLVILASSAMALSLRNIVRSVLLLVLSWFGIAAFYLWAGAEFAAFAQALVYGGAVSMVVLFAVLLTGRSHSDAEVPPPPKGRLVWALVAGGAASGIIAATAIRTPFAAATNGVPSLPVRDLGLLLMGPQLAALLVTGALLTAALLGAVVIAAGTKDDKEGAP